MTSDTPHENTQPDGSQPESTAGREATPRTWLRRIARRKRMLAHEQWRRLDDVAREGISDDDYAITMATLEAMARNLGWEESQAQNETRGDSEHDGHGHAGHRHGHWHRHHGHRHHGRCAERATVEA